MTDRPTPMVELQDVHHCYEDGVEALQGVSLTLDRGECVALAGHNGSGKSTLVKHLNGLLRPTSGTVRIDGESTKDARVAQLAKKVGLLFQDPNNQICKGSVAEEVAFGPRNLKFDGERIRELTTAALEAMDLSGKEKTNPHDLGWSERKRLSIASILAMDTEVVVLDEPTAGLDPREIRLLESALDTLRRQGRTTLIISHDMDFIAENTDRAICLGCGLKLYDGPVQGLFSDRPLLERCGLIPPQVVQVAERLGIVPLPMTPEALVDSLAGSRS